MVAAAKLLIVVLSIILVSGCVSFSGELVKTTEKHSRSSSVNASHNNTTLLSRSYHTKTERTVNNTVIQSQPQNKPKEQNHTNQTPREHHNTQTSRVHKTSHTNNEKPAACENACDSPCKALNATTCTCVTLLFCDGNGICEPTDSPGSSDCPDCNDGNPCTADWYNISKSACMHKNICKPNTHKETPKTAEQRSEQPVQENNTNSTQRTHLVITEVMYNPEQNDNYNEWIELLNAGAAPINLSEWLLCGKPLLSGYINKKDGLRYLSGTTVLYPGEFAIVTDGGTGTSVYENFNVSYAALSIHADASSLCSGALSNTGKNITLTNAKTNTTVFFDYSDYASCKEGFSLEYSAGAWSCSKEAGGTPGF